MRPKNWRGCGRYQKNPRTDPPMTLEEANRWVARWGGYLDRKQDGPPGPESIGIGLRRLFDITLGWRLKTRSGG
ncbi:MAG: IS4 family transposase [Limisphaerales bacterium]